MAPSTRFKSVTFDTESRTQAEHVIFEARKLEIYLETFMKNAPREKALALTKLEEFVMWSLKSVRTEQLDRQAKTPLPPG
jgi:hypothetical protein